MLHTKFGGNRQNRFRKEDFFTGFHRIGAWRPSWSCDQHHVIRFSLPESFHTKFDSDRQSWFWENPV